MYRCQAATDWEYLGGTIDDAAGEAFDKVAVMLGIPFPGGPNLANLAEQGDATRYAFPRPMLHDHSRLDFSFFGLKTAVRYQLVGTGKQDFFGGATVEPRSSRFCCQLPASGCRLLGFQSQLALKRTGLKSLCVGGGVAANRLLRTALEQACQSIGAELILARRDLCTDNAMMGALAWREFAKGISMTLGSIFGQA